MHVYSFYKFLELKDVSELRELIFKSLDKLDIKGTILLSQEGVNANISQDESLLIKAMECINKHIKISNVLINKSISNGIAFQKLKVKVKDEIIKFHYPIKEKSSKNLKTLNPKDWDSLLNEDVQVIDMRNSFEYSLGTFEEAIDLGLKNFTDLKDKKRTLNKLDKKKKTAIFCTGGVRCEKAGLYLNDLGFDDVYQLNGGIINYLNLSDEKKKWKGDCFVFDDRILIKN